MPIDLLIKTLRLLSFLRRHGFSLHRHPRPGAYLNIGFLSSKNTYERLSLPLTPTTTALEISHAVAASLNLPHEFDSKLQVFLLPYGFDLNDHRLLSFISLFPKNVVHREKYIHLLAPRKPPFPSWPAKRYRARTLDVNDEILPVLKPWKQDALHVWVGLKPEDERIIRFQNAVENYQLIIQEKEVMDRKCQNAMRAEVARAYNLRYKPRRMAGDFTAQRGLRARVVTTPIAAEKTYRCQITDEYFTIDRMAATTIYPHTLMVELKRLNEEIVDLLTGPENALLMSAPVAKIFDEGLFTIERRRIEQEGSDSEMVGEEYGYFLKVNYNRLLDCRVFAKEDWEGREHRERMKWKDINRKRIIFSDNGRMKPYKDFLEFHAELSNLIFGGVRLDDTHDTLSETFSEILSLSSVDWGSSSYISVGSPVPSESQRSDAGSPVPPRVELAKLI